MATLIRDRSGFAWNISQYEGRFVAVCDYGLGIKGSKVGLDRADVEAQCRNANFRG